MGGRGCKLLVDMYLKRSHKERTGEFQTLFKKDGISFIRAYPDRGSTSAPEFSNSPGSIYVNINNKNEIRDICVYGEDHKPIYTIHPGDDNQPLHFHKGSRTIDGKSEHFYLKDFSKEQLDLLEKAKQIHKEQTANGRFKPRNT